MKTPYLFFFLGCFTQLIAQSSHFKTGQTADFMLSGKDFNDCGGPLVFNHPSGLATDGTNLILCDRFNNRILIWDQAPTHWDQNPDWVLGQSDFSSNNPGKELNQLNWPGNVSAANGVIAVADTENDRILIWKHKPLKNGDAADIALSLPALTPNGSSKHYEWPWGVWTDGIRIAAVATTGSALLFWNTIPISHNQLPDYTIALPEFGTPRNISTDGKTYFFVGDHNAKVTGNPGTFFWNSFPTQTNQTFDYYRDEWIKGIKTSQGPFMMGGLLSYTLWNELPGPQHPDPDLKFLFTYYKNGDGPDIVEANGRFYVNNYNGNNVLVYNKLPSTTTDQPDWALASYNLNFNTLDSIGYIQNPNPATDGNKLIVSSDFDRAIYVYDQIPNHSGVKPDHKFPMQSYDGFCWDNALFANQFVTVGVTKVCIWNNTNKLDLKPDLIYQNKIGTAPFSELRGVALDNDFFYLADRNGKLWIWQGIPQQANQNPFLSLDFPGMQFNQMHSDGEYLTLSTENPPSTILIFKVNDLKNGWTTPWKSIIASPTNKLNLIASAIAFNGSLAVANKGNHQVLIWESIQDAGDFSKVIVLGQTSLQNTTPGIGEDRLFMPATLLAIQNQLWVGEFKFSSRILRFSSETTTKNEQVFQENSVRYYPNPIQNELTIESIDPEIEFSRFQLINLQGQIIPDAIQVQKSSENKSHLVFNTASISNGIYILQATMHQSLVRFKIIIQN